LSQSLADVPLVPTKTRGPSLEATFLPTKVSSLFHTTAQTFHFPAILFCLRLRLCPCGNFRSPGRLVPRQTSGPPVPPTPPHIRPFFFFFVGVTFGPFPLSYFAVFSSFSQGNVSSGLPPSFRGSSPSFYIFFTALFPPPPPPFPVFVFPRIVIHAICPSGPRC